ncbi:MAG TPA: sulfatase [Planctomycetota bacterium]|nr:sulfatase [Planctomycetota bacterium]
MHVFALLIACALASLTLCAGEPVKPNVLFICVDDLKPLLGCYGETFARTPSMDKLASRGVLFERAYCNQAVCSPSRNALMLGLRPQTLGIYDLATNFRKAVPDALTIAQHFQKSGYRTEAMGKIFHTGHGNREDAASWSVPHFSPRAPQYALKENNAPPADPNADKSKPENLPRGKALECADVSDDTYADGKIAAEAVRRLQAAKDKDEPFFMAVGFIRPHLPFVAPKKYWDLYDPQKLPQAARLTPPDGAPKFAPQFGGELRQYAAIPQDGPMGPDLSRQLIHGYYAATSYADAQIGRVLDALDETGLSKNTIVMLWGDHGFHLGDHGMWCKHTNYEEAARIPFILALPGAKGARTQALIETVDVYPTLAELAGVPVPTGIDGRSFAKVVRDPAAAARDHIIHVYPRGGGMLGRAIRTERYRLVEWKKPGAPASTAVFELYDYQADPGETKNLAAEQPEVVAKLTALLATHPEAKPQVPVGDKKK